ncbi:hypothetical protein Mapa_000191 [Marchantia paleacea]|nr:hypothetical protein Mapa_000191 [Marchantia paleacea]
MTLVSDIKLIRTDTTLDLSQKAEKGILQRSSLREYKRQVISQCALTLWVLSKKVIPSQSEPAPRSRRTQSTETKIVLQNVRITAKEGSTESQASRDSAGLIGLQTADAIQGTSVLKSHPFLQTSRNT